MGTFNANLLPTSTGLTLGNTNQRWTLYSQIENVTAIDSASSNPALSGFLSLASSDFIAWRNNANSGDVTLSKTGAASGTVPADTLVFSGSGIETTFISSSADPASAGAIRLATGDVLNFRNNANGGDVVGLQHNADDTVTVGGSAGIKSGPQSITGSGSLTGSLVVGGFIQATGNVSTGGTLGSTGKFTAFGQAECQGLLTADAGIYISGKIINYNNFSTVGNGIPAEYAVVNLTSQAAAITTTTLANANNAGQYRLSWNAKITTVDAVSSTLGALTIVYTDPDGVNVTLTSAAMIAAGTIATTSAGNTTGTVLIGIPQLLNCKASTNITYAFGYVSNTPGQMKYNLNVTLESL